MLCDSNIHLVQPPFFVLDPAPSIFYFNVLHGDGYCKFYHKHIRKISLMLNVDTKSHPLEVTT